MISKKMISALNEQIVMEASASHKYLAMANWCATKGMDGGKDFFLTHSREEKEHMMRIVDYLWEVDTEAIIPALEQPKHNYKNVKEVVEAAYKSEQAVTQSIYQLVELSLKEKDYQTHNFLQWYVAEQLEEEALMRQVMDKIKLIGQSESALYFIDKELSDINAAEAAAEGEE